MRRKPYIIGILAVGLALAGSFGTPGYSRIVSSAHSFQQYFHTMQSTAGSLGPIELLVYSLALTKYKSPETGKAAARPQPRP